jgi:hypothetical protein
VRDKPFIFHSSPTFTRDTLEVIIMSQEGAVTSEPATLTQRLRARMENDGCFVYFMAQFVRGAVTRQVAVINMELSEFLCWVETLTPEEAGKTRVAIEYEGGEGLARVSEIHPITR